MESYLSKNPELSFILFILYLFVVSVVFWVLVLTKNKKKRTKLVLYRNLAKIAICKSLSHK